MSALIDVQQENDIVWTMHKGELRAWQVHAGGLYRVDPVEALRGAGEALEPLYKQMQNMPAP